MKNSIISLIFVLAFLGGGNSCKIHGPEVITISDANPIQFWVNGVETFNQKEICSIAPVCFCQQFQCDDEIRIQAYDTDFTKGYRLKILNNVGSTLLFEDFFRRIIYDTPISPALNFSNPTFQGGTMNPWLNGTGAISGNEQNWAWSSNGNLFADATSSSFNNTKVLYQVRPNSSLSWPPGTYRISAAIINSSTGGGGGETHAILNAYASNDGFLTRTALTKTVISGTDPLNAGQSTTLVFEFTTTQIWTDIGFQYAKQGPSTAYVAKFHASDVHIVSGPELDLSHAIYDFVFIPSDYGICDEQVQMEIIDNSDQSIDAYSDCVKITQNDDCTVLINYSNSVNFAGLDFSDESPPIDFNLRIPAIFFDEDYPEEFEEIDLSNSQSIQLRSQVKAKRYLDIDRMPFYMHKKLKLVLAHDNITIDGDSWMKSDGYTIVPPAKKNYPLRRGTCWLTNKNYIQRNVL